MFEHTTNLEKEAPTCTGVKGFHGMYCQIGVLTCTSCWRIINNTRIEYAEVKMGPLGEAQLWWLGAWAFLTNEINNAFFPGIKG